MVSTRSSGCVVAITKITRSGGSSSVFSRAFDASPVSMCASSRITTLLREAAGAYRTISRSSRIWSMPRFDAASISITSKEVPAAISLQESHSPQGVAVGPFTQFSAFARILAAVVFPTPRAPEKMYPCATRSFLPLKNAIKNDRVAHAYIFSGARGVGKTTAARILAKALNCVKGPTATPCGECDSCKEIAAGTSLDVIEIDAASNRGIDQIRELREMVRYAPAASRSKVVILDEAHMLTGEASNALLKTLEEPPDRVIFVMATTQPEDLEDTIRSRSHIFIFAR